MTEREKRCLDTILLIDCCIASKEFYATVGEKDYGEKYDPWEEWPPTHLIFYFKDRFMKNEDPWGCIRFGKNNFKWSKIVHLDKDTILLVDNERSAYTENVVTRESIREQEIPRTTLRTVENLKNIHGTIYAVGIGRGVARRDGKNKWTLISKEIQGKMIADLSVFQAGFSAIDGFEAHKDLYAGGGHSDMWHYDGEHWRAIDLPILKMRIRAIVCAGDGKVYAVGRDAKIVVGKGDEWKVIEHDLTTHDFTDAVWYENKLYLCTEYRLYTLENDILKEIVDFGERAPYTFGSLYVNDGLLMSAGDSSIAIYDGKEWNALYGSIKKQEEAELLMAQDMKEIVEDMVEGIEDLVDAVKNLPKKK